MCVCVPRRRFNQAIHSVIDELLLVKQKFSHFAFLGQIMADVLVASNAYQVGAACGTDLGLYRDPTDHRGEGSFRSCTKSEGSSNQASSSSRMQRQKSTGISATKPRRKFLGGKRPAAGAMPTPGGEPSGGKPPRKTATSNALFGVVDRVNTKVLNLRNETKVDPADMEWLQAMTPGIAASDEVCAHGPAAGAP